MAAKPAIVTMALTTVTNLTYSVINNQSVVGRLIIYFTVVTCHIDDEYLGPWRVVTALCIKDDGSAAGCAVAV
jgi:hypothetical protein